jgi:hypothetical protein
LTRFLAILSILFLFTTSIISRAGYCFYVIRECATNTPATTGCCHEEESTQSANCCGNTDNIECEAENANREFSETSGVEDCRPENDCNKTICYRLVPPLLADGPNRSTLPHSDNTVSDIITHQIFLSSVAITKAADNNPPGRIHPSISTTVLRI